MGWLLRERTDLVLGFCMFSVVSADVAAMGLRLPEADRLYPRSIARIDRTKRMNLLAGVTLAVLAMAASYGKMPNSNPTPYYPEHRIFSGGIWTVSCVGINHSAETTGAFRSRRARERLSTKDHGARP
jgi:hypothetical protein